MSVLRLFVSCQMILLFFFFLTILHLIICVHLNSWPNTHPLLLSLIVDFMKNSPDLGNEPFDIEDLVNMGRMQGP